MTFPSPIGELHFSIVLFATLGIFLWIVSVPYRGATFLNSLSNDSSNSFEIVSVPYRGATFLNSIDYETLDNSIKFPSPIGELHFSITYTKILEETTLKVSVPYRGATFLNKSFLRCSVKTGFRPLSGSYISQCLQVFSIECLQNLFPSPIGELHFSIPSPQPHVLSGTNRGIAGEK